MFIIENEVPKRPATPICAKSIVDFPLTRIHIPTNIIFRDRNARRVHQNGRTSEPKMRPHRNRIRFTDSIIYVKRLNIFNWNLARAICTACVIARKSKYGRRVGFGINENYHQAVPLAGEKAKRTFLIENRTPLSTLLFVPRVATLMFRRMSMIYTHEKEIQCDTWVHTRFIKIIESNWLYWVWIQIQKKMNVCNHNHFTIIKILFPI